MTARSKNEGQCIEKSMIGGGVYIERARSALTLDRKLAERGEMPASVLPVFAGVGGVARVMPGGVLAVPVDLLGA